MAPTVVIVADELADELGPTTAPLAAVLLHDTVAIACSLREARVVLRHCPSLPPAALDGLGPAVALRPIGAAAPAQLSEALADALAAGEPAILMGGQLPHLPLSRLRDALAHLDDGADLVVGPGDNGGWYLLGLRAPFPELLPLLPGLDAPADGLAAAARAAGHSVVALPAWFAIRARADMAGLAEALRPLPPGYAPQTRALLGADGGRARAVGG